MRITPTTRRSIAFFLFLFLLPFGSLAEQDKEKNPEKKKKWLFQTWEKTYASVYCRTGAFLYDPVNLGRLQLKIPYTYTLLSASPIYAKPGKSLFTFDQQQVFSRPAVYMAPVIVEIGSNGYFANLNFLGFMLNCWDGAYFSAGFGYSVTLRTVHLPHLSLGPKKKYFVVHGTSRFQSADALAYTPKSPNPWVIKPAIQLGYYGFYRHIGSIDNSNKNISMMDCVSGPADNNKGANASPTSLDLYFGQQTVQLAPTLGISKSLGSVFNMGLSASWMIPVFEQGGLALDNNGYSSHNVNSTSGWGLIPLNRSDIQAQYNGKKISDTPFRFGGLSLEFCFGFHWG